jgi:hypothetical protein
MHTLFGPSKTPNHNSDHHHYLHRQRKPHPLSRHASVSLHSKRVML